MDAKISKIDLFSEIVNSSKDFSPQAVSIKK